MIYYLSLALGLLGALDSVVITGHLVRGRAFGGQTFFELVASVAAILWALHSLGVIR